MKRKIKVLYVSAEISPYASAGGLGEVAKSLPEAMAETENIEVRRIMPLYQCVSASLQYVTDFSVRMDQEYETCVVKEDTEVKDVVTYFVGNDRYYHRDRIYAYEDDGFRFFFFCRAVAELLKQISFRPDIVHLNDWHTGFLALLLRREFPDIRIVYTIHNISYHGFIPSSYLRGMLSEAEEMELGYPQWLNFMKAGIKYADLVTTVSPGYADEISREPGSCGLSELITARGDHPIGILNGIDTVEYNPAREGDLIFPYDSENLGQKKSNRSLLRKEYGLPDSDIPLLAMVSRLDYAKGMDILLKAVSYLDLKTFQLIILGSGKPYYHGMLACISATYGDNIVVDFNYSLALAKRIYAAADIYLMPSLYEPCGLGQLYAMRYGAVPVVNPVGGLKNTVMDDPLHPEAATGFHMENWSGEALARAIRRAVTTYHTSSWDHYMKNAMLYDSSWKNSAPNYLKYYDRLISGKSKARSYKKLRSPGE